MKIRTGFVSNSSTSSFVMIGAIIDDKKLVENLSPEERKSFENDFKSDIISYIYEAINDIKLNIPTEYNVDKGKTLVGEYVVSMSSEEPYLGDFNITIDELAKKAAEMSAMIEKKFGHKVPKEDFKIYGGTEMC